MVLDILRQLNWIDIFVIILLFRICYVSLNNDIPTEFFKLLGTVTAIYLSLHYYTALSDWMTKRFFIPKHKMPLEFLDFLSLVILTISGYLIFVLLREAFYRFFKIEAGDRLNKWGGLALGIVRGILLSSLIIFVLVISSITYFKNSVINSYSGLRLFKLAPQAYTRVWNGFMSKIMTKEKLNDAVLEVEEVLSKK